MHAVKIHVEFVVLDSYIMFGVLFCRIIVALFTVMEKFTDIFIGW